MFDAPPRPHDDPATGAAPESATVLRPLFLLWLARVRAGREDAYRDFAERVVRPMFQAHSGCRGVTFPTFGDGHYAVLTHWRSPDDVVGLKLSPRYQHAFEQLMGGGLIEAVAPVSLWPAPVDVATWSRTFGQRVARALELLAPVPPTHQQCT